MVKLKAIDVKMLRDLRGMYGQAIAIAFVIIAGVSTYVAMRSVYQTLQHTLSAYYEDFHFADGFASIRRAPEELADRLRAVPGVSQVETRVAAGVNLEVRGFGEPVSGLIVSVPEGRQPLLNQLYIRRGRIVAPAREDEVVLNETFAEAHGLDPGDELTAIVNGRRRTLTVVGIALSPEFLMMIEPGSIFPDPQRYGVMWMNREALAAAYDMEGAFNDAAFTLAPAASVDEVIARMDRLLEPYGGQGAYPRSEQASHFLISEEFRGLQQMATMLPVIFLAVAAFLLNIVVTRLINLQREQIAVLKAFGYDNRAVGFHYVKLVLVVAVVGSVAGSFLGIWLGRQMGELYLQFYRFPYLQHVVDPVIILTAVLLTTGASLVGVINAVRRAVALPPAEAMRPAPPASYKPTFVERIGLRRLFDQPTRMILRNLERQPVKATLSIVGIACSCAILIMGLFFTDAFDYVIQVQYGLSQREDLTVTFNQPTSRSAVHELQSLPGVVHAEPFRSVPVRLRYEHRSEDAAIEGIPEGAYLRRIIDLDLKPIPIPRDGLVMSDHLAKVLGVRAGNEVIVEVREGTRQTKSVPVVAIAQQYIGMGAYMNMEALNRLAGNGQAVSGAFLLVDEQHHDELNQALRDRPRVAGIVATERAIQAFYDTSAASMLTFTFILSLFAGVIAFGVVYNSVRISLSERDRELASLRVLGFTRGEVSYILLGEMAVLVLLAIPVGFILGALASTAVVQSFETDLYQIPVVLHRDTFALAAVIVLIAAVLSAFIVRRKLNRLDLVGVLKTRE